MHFTSKTYKTDKIEPNETSYTNIPAKKSHANKITKCYVKTWSSTLGAGSSHRFGVQYSVRDENGKMKRITTWFPYVYNDSESKEHAEAKARSFQSDGDEENHVHKLNDDLCSTSSRVTPAGAVLISR